ncbi:tripartite tricarboxylate transporter substrate binding protein [Achromobacter sp. GG226]|uniref:Bug family tripartite tricarboxylate transporter substrate binding protein n=1 Tax=Verticiella alkaliphila TaxID=2779529 RepID=UPI001C0E09DC|nr:tripartite tricarboxylate transporter substrate binding protein [Verticiella sp. GG226]MBU4611495.1 tripartite tricarboxylate transporter substrate binding protein [Verticiella sp. GG226]
MTRSNTLSRRIATWLATLAVATAAGSASAADFPSRPITFVVPYAAGATTDLLARTLGNQMAQDLGQPVVIENKAGANGIIGTAEVARSKPDGYTMLLSTDSSMVLNKLLYTKLPYDPDRLTPVALLSDLPVVLVVNADLPVNNLEEFVAYARAHPGKLNFGSTGKGGSFHLAAELFSQQAAIQMTHVPYRGGSPGVAALMTNEIQAWFGVIGSTLPFIESGKLKALALAHSERLPILNDVPTFAEAGYPAYQVLIRYGLAVAAGTPDGVIDALAHSARSALAQPEFRESFQKLGFVVPESTGPAEYKEVIEHDHALWSEIIRKQNITLD